MDLTTPAGLERAVALASLGCSAEAPASAEELAALEERLGFDLPELLRELLARTDGLQVGGHVNLMRVGGGTPDESEAAGIADVWAFYREQHAAIGVEAEAGWIGCDALPLTNLLDGNYLVWNRESDEVCVHTHDQGSVGGGDFGDLEDWLCWLVAVGIARGLERGAGDLSTCDVVDALARSDSPRQNRSPETLERVGAVVEALLAGELDAAAALAKIEPVLSLELV